MFSCNRAQLKRLSWYLLVAVFSINVCAQILFGLTLPQVPTPVAGRIYALNEHGTIVYLTYWEHLIVGPFSSAVILLLMLIWVFLHRARDGTWDRAGDER